MVLSIQHNHMAINTYRNLQKAGFTMNKAMEKLASGYRINTAADSPADLIMSEQLRSRIAGLEKAIQNARTSANVLDVADGALGEVQGILRGMNQLALKSLNSGVTTADQTAANQAEMDIALQSIDRILKTTSFAGRKLLDNLNLGSGYTPPAGNGKLVVDGKNTDSPTDAGTLKPSDLPRTGADGLPHLSLTTRPANAEPAVDENGLLLKDKTFTLVGRDGNPETAETVRFAAGTSLDDMVAKLREYTIAPEQLDSLDPDYVPPSVRSGDDIDSVVLSLNDLAHIQKQSDADAADFLAGHMKNFVPEGLLLTQEGQEFDRSKLSEGQLKVLELSENLMNMTSDGLGNVQVSLGFDKDGNEIFASVSLADLWSGGQASLEKDPAAALQVIKQAVKDISASRAQIGATRKYALETNENLLMSELESYTRCESFLRDTDMASATVEFTRSKLVSQVGTQLLKAANESSQSILSLLV